MQIFLPYETDMSYKTINIPKISDNSSQIRLTTRILCAIINLDKYAFEGRMT